MLPKIVYKLNFVTLVFALYLRARENSLVSVHNKSIEFDRPQPALPFDGRIIKRPIVHSKFNKRVNGPGLSVQLQADWAFACPTSPYEERVRFKWKTQYNALTQLVTPVALENIDEFPEMRQQHWNPIMYKGTYTSVFCRRLNPREVCYYRFTGHFYGQVYPSHMNMIMTTTRAEHPGPRVEEYCVESGRLPTATTQVSSCIVYHIFVTRSAR